LGVQHISLKTLLTPLQKVHTVGRKNSYVIFKSVGNSAQTLHHSQTVMLWIGKIQMQATCQQIQRIQKSHKNKTLQH